VTYRVDFTRGAQSDLLGLFDYLADRFGIPNAQRYVEQIEKTCLSLGTMPNRGTERSDLTGNADHGIPAQSHDRFPR